MSQGFLVKILFSCEIRLHFGLEKRRQRLVEKNRCFKRDGVAGLRQEAMGAAA
jgi:hypothetical protein